MIRTIVAAWLVVLYAGTVCAQSTPTDGGPEPDTRQIGVLYVKPTVALTNAGVDTNVFNVPDSANPESDFTMTVTPAATVWLPFGLTWIRGSVQEDLVWYKKFESERSANTGTSLAWTVPMTRFTAAVRGGWLRTNDRPGFEIDQRADRWEKTVGGSFELRTLSRTFFGVSAERRGFTYDEDESFQGVPLTDLNRRQVTEGVTMRHDLTPLTSLVFEVGLQQDRFDTQPLRDTDSVRALGGFKLAPDALISGSALVGYRNLDPDSEAVPTYSGAIAHVDVAYVARSTTKLTLKVNRDVEYSYDVNQPYYLLTDLTGTVTQQVYGPLDIQGRLIAERLSYRDRQGADIAVSNRVDNVRSYGGGVGYNTSEDLRVGFNVDYQQRTSPLPDREYDGWKFGTTVNYGF